MKIERVPLKKLSPWDRNPRKIDMTRMSHLKKSIENDPDFMELRPLLATKKGMIYAGNQRFQAVQELGWEDVPCIITDISDELAKERAIKDNNQFGEWDNSISELLEELAAEGVDIDTLGLSVELEKMAKNLEQVNADAEWDNMPEYSNEDKSAFKQVIISFTNDENFQKFQRLLGVKMTMKTKSVWYPLQQQDKITEEFE